MSSNHVETKTPSNEINLISSLPNEISLQSVVDDQKSDVQFF